MSASPQPETTQVGNLDMSRNEDRGLLRRMVTDQLNHRRRWGGIDDQTKADFVSALKVAMRMAIEKKDHRAIANCVTTLATLERQNQTDEQTAVTIALKGEPDRHEHSGPGGAPIPMVAAVITDDLRERANSLLSDPAVRAAAALMSEAMAKSASAKPTAGSPPENPAP